MHASEDASSQQGQKRPNLLQRVGNGIASGARSLSHAISNVHPFGSVVVEKNQGEKPTFGAVAGVRVGNGASSTGEDPRGEDRDWALERMHLGEPKVKSEKEAFQEIADAKRKRRQEYEDLQRKAQKETENYANTALSLADDTAAYFKLPQGQSKSQGQARPTR